jgi:hypothetical protein
MEAKTFEVRDRGTFIPILAVKLTPSTEADRYLLGRAGFGTRPEDQAAYVVVVRIAGGTGKASCDPFDWSIDHTRTLQVAHQHIIKKWSELASGDVVDVEYLLALSPSPKPSESRSVPL